MDLIVILLAILAVLIIAFAVIAILIWHNRRISRLEQQRWDGMSSQEMLKQITALLERLNK